MKYIASTIAITLIASNALLAQTALSDGKSWKVAELTTVYKDKKIITYHKDSLKNSVDYSNIKFSFNADGSYAAENIKDNSIKSGSWSIKNTGDSAKIDSVNFALVKLSSDSFITRGYSVYMVDTAGRRDTAYNYLKLYNVSGSLRVDLASFTGQFAGNNVLLTWSTSFEQYNKQFDIEFSHDSTSFEKIGMVQGSGNSTVPLRYTFNDLDHFKPGKNYYRLKEIGLDGIYKFSPIVVVSVNEARQSSVSIYPNPATDQIILSIKQPSGANLILQLTDVAGRKILSKTLSGNNTSMPVMLPKLGKGIYIVSIVNDKGENLLTERLVIQ